jgi:hypothetical protein
VIKESLEVKSLLQMVLTAPTAANVSDGRSLASPLALVGNTWTDTKHLGEENCFPCDGSVADLRGGQPAEHRKPVR